MNQDGEFDSWYSCTAPMLWSVVLYLSYVTIVLYLCYNCTVPVLRYNCVVTLLL
jgi:hypothetical protein